MPGLGVLDFTGAEAIEQIRSELAAQGTTFAIARSRGLFDLALHRTGLAIALARTTCFPRSGPASRRTSTRTIRLRSFTTCCDAVPKCRSGSGRGVDIIE